MFQPRRVADVIKNRIRSFSWTTNPVDLQDGYISHLRAADQMKGSAMPPSPGVECYRMEHYYRSDIIEAGYNIQFRLRPGMEVVVKELMKRDPLRLTHRSRIVALLYRPLQINEFIRRSEKARSLKSASEPFKLETKYAEEIFYTIIFETLKSLRFDESYVHKYASAHATSSTGEGLMWSELERELTREDWKELYDITEEILEGLVNRLRWYISTPLYLGARARSESFTKQEIEQYISSGYQAKFSRTISRARLVLFHPALSMWSAFIPSKNEWYARILSKVESILKISEGSVHYPVVDGGMVYVTASELLSAGAKYVCYDGVTWDAIVGLILGETFQPLLIYLDGTSQVPSGITVTSLLDTIAMMVVYSKLYNGVDAIILGDDLNLFPSNVMTKSKTELIEYQLEDTRRQFMLGLNFNPDPLVPVIDGLKITSDRADLQYTLDYAVDDYGTNGPQHGKHSHQEQLLYYGMYFGRFGDQTLIEAVSRRLVGDESFYGPTQTIQDLSKEPMSTDKAGDWVKDMKLKPAQLLTGVSRHGKTTGEKDT